MLSYGLPVITAMETTLRPARRRRWIWIAIGLLILAGGIGAGLYATRAYGRNGQALTADDLDLRLGTTAPADVQITLNEIGTIEPIVKVEVKSTLSGRVIDLLVREGERVRRGQVLARVEPDVNQAQTLSQVKSELNLAAIRATDATRELETHTQLHRERFLSDRELKDVRVRYEEAMEALEAARTRMRIVEESGIPLDAPISTLQRVNIVAPMDGTVIKRNVEVGQTVMSGVSSFNEGTVLYAVADLRSMILKASVNEIDVGKIRTGQAVVITVDAFPYRRFDGAITHIAPAARLNDKVKVFDIEVGLKEQVPEFRAGMSANLEVRGARVEGVLAIPVEAIFSKEEGEVVYVLREPFRDPPRGAPVPRRTRTGRYDISEVWERYFEERPVRIGLVGLEKAQVLEGLAEGTRVALENPLRPPSLDEED